MLVSVIVPAYQAEQCIGGCVRALLAQTFAELEILFVDDGSTDATGALLDAEAALDARIRVLHQPNAGVSTARNVGIKHARGEYITFVDADDILPPQAVARLYEAVGGHGSPIDIVTANHTMIASDGQARLMTCPPEPDRAEIIGSLIRCDGHYNAVWGKLYRRAFLQAHGLRFPLDVRIGEDVLFNLRAFGMAQRLAHVPESLYTYRMHTVSAMGSQRAQTYTAHLPMLRGMDAWLRLAGCKAQYYRSFLELHAGLLARSNAPPTFDSEARKRVNGGVSPHALTPKEQMLWYAIAARCSALACRWVGRGIAG